MLSAGWVVSSPGILLYPAAACLVTQRFIFKMADGKTKVTAPSTVPTKRAEELTGDEATGWVLDYYHMHPLSIRIGRRCSPCAAFVLRLELVMVIRLSRVQFGLLSLRVILTNKIGWAWSEAERESNLFLKSRAVLQCAALQHECKIIIFKRFHCSLTTIIQLGWQLVNLVGNIEICSI